MRILSRSGRRQELVLLSVIAIVGVVFLWSLRAVTFQAQVFPMLVLGLLLGFTALKLVLLFSGAPVERRAPLTGTIADQLPETASQTDSSGVSLRAVWIWIVATVAVLIGVGLMLGTGLSVFGYLRIVRRERWIVAIGIALLVSLVVLGVFGNIMRIDVWSGALLHH